MSVQTYRLKHGEMTCIAISDGNLFMGPSRIFFYGAERSEMQAVLKKYGLLEDGLNLACSCLVVETANYRLLIDCGAGAHPRFPELGKLMDGLSQEGIDPASINYVVLSHGHFDHVVGCTQLDGTINFPNARFVMSKAEWQYWAVDAAEPMSPLIRQNLLSIRPQLELVEPDCEIAEGLRLLHSPGHTANHTAVEITVGDACLLCPVDCFDHHFQVEYPQWGAEWDVDHAQSILSRMRMLKLAAEKNALMHGYHFDFPGFGKVKSEGNIYSWETLQ
jgi:glyoxylase-like metal-dependent hydrolase (beta-lactamase superfamily II)